MRGLDEPDSRIQYTPASETWKACQGTPIYRAVSSASSTVFAEPTGL